MGTTRLNPGAGGQLNQGQAQLLEQQREIQQRREQQGQERQPTVPVLKAGDSVIIEIGFHLPPRPASETMGGAAQAQISPQNLEALKAVPASSAGNPAAAQAQPSVPEVAADQLSDADKQRLSALMDTIRAHDPYTLSNDGELMLPGFAPIPLLGLTQDQATLRLSVVPAFQNIAVRLTLLPL